jgi:hypothetical protein
MIVGETTTSSRTRLVTEVVGGPIHVYVERVSKLDLGIAREADSGMQFLQ